MREPSRRDLRRAKRRSFRRKAGIVSLIFIFLALALNWGLIYKNRNPLSINTKQSANPVRHIPKLFKSSNINGQLQKRWKADIQGSGGNVNIAVYSKKTGETYSYNTTPGHTYHMASTVKVSVLAGSLLQNNGSLDSQGKDYAEAMIENSDNDSTTDLVNNYLGGTDGLQQTFNQFQMTDSKANDAWGMTSTSATDQVKLLNNIFFSSNKLTSTEQNYIKHLMYNVESDQQWGISSGSQDFALKNGWLTDDDTGKWIINSIGYINGSGDNDYTIAVYTDGNSTMKSGEKLIGKLARSTKDVLSQQ